MIKILKLLLILLPLSLFADNTNTYTLDISNQTANENDSNITFTVRVDTSMTPFTDTVLFDYNITNISTSSNDYAVTDVNVINREINIPDTFTYDIVIPIVNDTNNEGNETFKVTIYNFRSTNLEEGLVTFGDTTQDSAIGTIIDNDSIVVPSINNLSISIDENISVGTYIGTVPIISNGGETISSFTLINEDDEISNLFSINNIGKITTLENLDYETTNSYSLTAYATNSVGNSESKNVNILINNVVENSEFSLHITSLDLNEYNITSITAIDTNGSEINLNGLIENGSSTLNATLLENRSYYLRFTLNDSINTMWFNFSRNTITEEKGLDTNYLLTATNGNLYNINFRAINQNIVTLGYAPTINMIYDWYKINNSEVFDVNVTLRDKDHDLLDVKLIYEPQDIISITNTDGNISYSSYKNNKYNMRIQTTNKIGSIKLKLEVKDGVNTVSKIFNIIVEKEYLKNYIKHSTSYDNTTGLNIDFIGTKLFGINDQIFNNYILGKNRFLVNIYKFNGIGEGVITNSSIIDLNSSVSTFNQNKQYYKTQNGITSVYKDSLYTDKLYEFKYTNMYNNNGLSEIENFLFSNSNSKAYKVLKKYTSPSLELYENVIYNQRNFTSLNEFKSTYSIITNSMGLVRNYKDKSKMLFIDFNNDGTLIEIDNNGHAIMNDNGTYNAGTWEEITLDSYKYKDINQVWHTVNSPITVLVLNPTVSGYSKGTAFAVANNAYVKMGQYYKVNDVVETLYYNKEAMKEIYNKFSTSPKISKTLNNGWTYVSLPTKMTLCDSSIQSILNEICNQSYSLNSVFSNNSIKYILRNTNSSWTYWDTNTSINSYYKMNKFQALNYKDGMYIKTNSQVDIDLPYDIFNDEEIISFRIEQEGWKLVTLNSTKTVEEIKDLVENNNEAINQNKLLKYILVYRNNKWLIYSPSNNDEISNEIQRLNRINKYETFWIYTKNRLL